MSKPVGADDVQPILLSVKDVLRKTQIGKSFFYNMVRAGQGPTITKLGDRTFVSRENLDSWLKTQELNRPTAA
jgi:predicted DNA-binding transcriptional regulator AlpA